MGMREGAEFRKGAGPGMNGAEGGAEFGKGAGLGDGKGAGPDGAVLREGAGPRREVFGGEAEPMTARACQAGSGKGAGLREGALEGGAWRGGVARDGRGLWVGGAWVGGGAGIRLGHSGGRDIKGGGA